MIISWGIQDTVLFYRLSVVLSVCSKNRVVELAGSLGMFIGSCEGVLGKAPQITCVRLVCSVSAVWPPVRMRTQIVWSDWLTAVVIVEQLVWRALLSLLYAGWWAAKLQQILL